MSERQFTDKTSISIGSREVSIELTYSVSPKIAARFSDLHSGGWPASGGDVEVKSAVLLLDKGFGTHATVERIEAPAWLLDIIQNDEDVIACLSDLAGDNADDEEGEAADRAYDNHRDSEDRDAA